MIYFNILDLYLVNIRNPINLKYDLSSIDRREDRKSELGDGRYVENVYYGPTDTLGKVFSFI